MLIILLFERSFFHPYNFGWLHALIHYVDLSVPVVPALPWGKTPSRWPSWVTQGTPSLPSITALNRGSDPIKQYRLFAPGFATTFAKRKYWWSGNSAGVNHDMFSTTPRIGTFTLGSINIFMALMASITATCCGVVTMTTPVTGLFVTKVSCTSPVPEANP